MISSYSAILWSTGAHIVLGAHDPLRQKESGLFMKIFFFQSLFLNTSETQGDLLCGPYFQAMLDGEVKTMQNLTLFVLRSCLCSYVLVLLQH